jgi:hypothetical protein
MERCRQRNTDMSEKGRQRERETECRQSEIEKGRE